MLYVYGDVAGGGAVAYLRWRPTRWKTVTVKGAVANLPRLVERFATGVGICRSRGRRHVTLRLSTPAAGAGRRLPP